jgi:hypothetical protein
MGARILLCYPDAPIAAMPDAFIDSEVEDEYCRLITTLQALPYDEETPYAVLSHEARRQYRERDAAFKREWPPDVAPRLDEALSKLCIYAGRLTNLLIAACEVSSFATTHVACVDAAWQLIGYFRHCALRMHGDGGERYEHARRILGWIERTRKDRFNLAELRDDLRRSLDRSEDLDAALTMLEERQYIRLLPEPPRTGKGRKPSAQYAVNPEMWRKNPKNTGNADAPANKSDKSYSSAANATPATYKEA